MSLKEKLSSHPLLETLITVKGNSRYALYLEPLWAIPFFMYTPFVSVYMAALLLSDQQIGLIASIFMFSRAVTAIFAGAITDKLGRRLSTFIFDTLSWTIPCLLWAFSQNFWWFVIAAAFSGLTQVPHTSWMCLLVEDAKKEVLVNVFSLLHIVTQMAIIFAPISALMVDRMSVIPALRILYLFAAILMTTKFLILLKFSTETEVGKTRLRETKGMSIWRIMGGYGEIVKKIFASRGMVLSLTITAVFNIVGMISGSFFGLYVTGTLLIPEYFLAYFPIIRAFIVTTFIYWLQPKMNKFGFRNPILIGLIIFTAGHILLIFTPENSLFLLIIFILCDAVAFSFVIPRTDFLTQILIEPAERARISGIIFMIVLGMSIPFGYIAGLLSNMDRRFPFILIVAIFIIMFVFISINKKMLEAVKENVEQGA